MEFITQKKTKAFNYSKDYKKYPLLLSDFNFDVKKDIELPENFVHYECF